MAFRLPDPRGMAIEEWQICRFPESPRNETCRGIGIPICVIKRIGIPKECCDIFVATTKQETVEFK